MEKKLFKKRGKKLEGNNVIVSVTKNGQYSLTIPRKLAKQFKLKKKSVVHWDKVEINGVKYLLLEHS